jgi:hypothetical protein
VEGRTQAFECADAVAVSAKASVRKQEINRPEDLLEVEALLAGRPLVIVHLLEGSRSSLTRSDDGRRPFASLSRSGTRPRWLVSFAPSHPGNLADMATRDTRREENQRMFRGGNEALRDAARNIGFESTPVPFMCECASIDCRGQVEVTPREWERVVARPKQYLMIAGHQRIEGEEIVGSLHAYEIARKPG